MNIKQKKTEDLQQFRQRLYAELQEADVKTMQIEFDFNKVIDFLLTVKRINEKSSFEQNQGWFCRYCEFEEYCMKGWNYFMKLPSTENSKVVQVGFLLTMSRKSDANLLLMRY